MPSDRPNRRRVLKRTGATLAALGSASGTALACPGCGGDDDDDGGSSGSEPSVTTKSPSVSGDSVEFNGTLDAVGDDDSADCWFEWGPEGDGLPNDTNIQILSSPDWFSDSRDGLASGTYEVRAVASNDWGKAEGSIATFTI